MPVPMKRGEKSEKEREINTVGDGHSLTAHSPN